MMEQLFPPLLLAFMAVGKNSAPPELAGSARKVCEALQRVARCQPDVEPQSSRTLRSTVILERLP